MFLRLVAYAIAGHHAGLADHGPAEEAGTLLARLAKPAPEIADALARAPRDLLDHPLPAVPDLSRLPPTDLPAFRLAFWTRMLFSCLVDADYLATEHFMDEARSSSRSADTPLGPLLERVINVIDALSAGATGAVAQARRHVVADCRAAADRPRGFFTLTVPTGGGKTLASMNFALAHALRHGLRRVIVAVPFTSIIDQNARVYREALGDEAVLEDHSNFDPFGGGTVDGPEPKQTPVQHAMAAENWTAPVIVTTTVQLFESLFAARPGPCRKLHRIARSVIVLDEAQALPVTLLAPILATLRELVDAWGCTVVLCTATQPALGYRKDRFEIGLPLTAANEIIRDVPALFAGLRRTRVRAVGLRTDEQTVERLMGMPAALCIVNTRRHAARLFTLLRARDPEALHLSASMCPAHREVVIQEVRRRLQDHRPCRVVSTQVIEAGVDVDFPLVLRSMAGLDSIAQAAGRCNREGRADVGEVEVFEADEESEGTVPYDIANPRDATASVLPDHARDPLAPEAIEHFFRLRYALRGWPRGQMEFDCGRAAAGDPRASRSVMRCFRFGAGERGGPPSVALDFRTAADRFAMIDDHQQPVLVPFERAIPARQASGKDVRTFEGPELIEHLRLGHPLTREFFRRAQRYSVNVPRHRVLELMRAGAIEELPEGSGIYVLVREQRYDDKGRGLDTDDPGGTHEFLCV